MTRWRKGRESKTRQMRIIKELLRTSRLHLCASVRLELAAVSFCIADLIDSHRRYALINFRAKLRA